MIPGTSTPGGLRSRPMSSIVKSEEGKIYFLSDARASKDYEIASHPDILLTYGNGSSQFVSTRANAVTSTDRALIKKLWNPGAQAFWPKGPDDPDVIAIIATPTIAEYWDGSAGILGTAKMAYALLTGTAPDLGDNSKVTL